MKIRPLILLVIFITSIFPPAHAMVEDPAHCQNEDKEEVYRNIEDQNKPSSADAAPCCTSTVNNQSTENTIAKDQKDDCCSDDCDCSCCLHATPVSLSFVLNKQELVKNKSPYFSQKRVFGYQERLDQGFTGNLLQPPRD